MARKSNKDEYILTLYITGMSNSAVRAVENIKKICEEHLKNNYTLEVIDVYKNPERLQKDDIIACPTLVKLSPSPYKKLIGDLSDKSRVLKALNISTE